ncbi:hypothetical protein MYSTI_05973 [Myxococcus stipitatus DSM 14675]|uniref:Lipoprotein n=1 Tax=Myxococcus stipitatus (strain DSM 14675 / JCM 12634 / Mx s8) TaxID=1278073 RepID=L7UE99_MYXSD|nr:hypothetical protein [Myxococcus stipitatus]AGC47246.1 hypothetical protein MYSTI_05973 [Myxococcus stipitatus DSM 14675]
MRLALFPLLATLLTGGARAAELTVTSLTVIPKPETEPGYPQEAIRMPFITHGNPDLAARINDRLFISRFKARAPAKAEPQLSAPEFDLAGLARQTFAVTRNDARLLTIRFDAEGCGAYCETYSVAYSFDLRTGRLLTSQELFTPAGVRTLTRRMHQEKQRRYRAQIAQTEKELKAARKKKADDATLADLAERIDFNRECLSRLEENEEETLRWSAVHDRWEFKSGNAVWTDDRCSNHAMRALDDVGPVSLTLPYPALRPHLTAYGKRMLLGEGQASSSDVFGQVLHGLIGESPIVLVMEKADDGSVSGMYFDKNHLKPLLLSGQVTGGKLEMQELDADGNPTANVRLELGDKHLSGDWVGNTPLPMKLSVP